MENLVDIEKPKEPVSLMYATVKKEMLISVKSVMQKYPLPLYMIHSILEGISAELKGEAYLELADETWTYASDLQQYFIEREKQMIKDFENGKEG